MADISRRRFFKKAAAGAAAAGLLPGALELSANPLGMPIGCQTYPVRAMIGQDFPGTIKQLADIGFQRIELCSPVGYASSGFGVIAKYKGAELRKIFGDLGVKCESSHFSMKELRDNLAGSIAWAKDVGLTQMIVPSLGGPRTPTMDDVKKAADEYNKIGEQSAKAGIQQGLHNENFELTEIDGKRTYDILLDLLDPKLVKFQFQVSTISRGYGAAEYFMKYPGRFFSMHVQDWSSETKQTMAVGQGTLDWKKIFTAAKTGGVKSYFVEMNLDLMKASVPYLRELRVS
jgi:sugar phosphate isomerase/epimerase